LFWTAAAEVAAVTVKKGDVVVTILDKISRAFGKFATLLACVILIAVFMVISAGIVCRFTGLRLSWTEELARWGLISLCYVGASAALRNRQHVGVNIVVNALPHKLAKIAVGFAYLTCMVIVVYFFFNSGEAALKASRIRGDIIPISLKYVKLLLPMSFFMMFFHLAWGFSTIFGAKQISDVTIGV
jgi:TRAP-type C4-dicarboxylate transport system permease small subunit